MSAAPGATVVAPSTPSALAPLAASCGLAAPSPAGTSLLAAHLDGLAVGYVEFRQVLDEAELIAIGVAPDARRQGHGAALMAAFLAAVSGWAQVHLEVREGNAQARALYEAFGFRVVGLRARYYGDGEAAVLYRLTR